MRGLDETEGRRLRKQGQELKCKRLSGRMFAGPTTDPQKAVNSERGGLGL